MENIAIIGASGFVGSALLKEALNRGHKVTAIVRNPEKISLSNQNLTVEQGDVRDIETVQCLVNGMSTVISAYNPGWSNPELYHDTLKAYCSIIEGCKEAEIKRLLIVGGAGSLYINGIRLLDMGVLEETILPGAKSLAEVLYSLQKNEKELDWVFFSPAANIAPGERTGKFRLGKDDLITDTEGKSNISVEDYAVAMIDEMENPKHHFERFTIGY
jgi:Putative NADH-flavin reductase